MKRTHVAALVCAAITLGSAPAEADTARTKARLAAGEIIVSSKPVAGSDQPRATVIAVVDAAPERMLWASNWPHPEYQGVYDDAMLLDTLAHWVEDEAVRQRILVDNPATLYGF